MKYYNTLYFLRKRQINFTIVLSFFIWLVSSINFIICFDRILQVSNSNKYLLCNMDFIISFDVISILQDTNFTYMINPLFCACCIYIINSNSHILKVIRYNSKKKLWNNNFFMIILFSFITSTLLVFGTYIIASIILGNFNSTWFTDKGYFYKIYGNTNMWPYLRTILKTKKMLAIIFLSTFICFGMFGSIISVANIFMKQRYIFISMISLVFVDYINICDFCPLKSSIISLENIIDINTLVTKNIYYLLIILFLYLFGKFLIVKKDQFIRK